MAHNFNIHRVLDSSDVISSDKTYFDFVSQVKTISNEFQLHKENAVHITSSGGGEYTNSNAGAQFVDDLLVTIGWGDGFAIRRLNDDGSLTMLYEDLYPSNNYKYNNSLAIDKDRKQIYVANSVYDNIIRYSFADEDVFEIKKETLTEEANGLPSDQVGYSYANGLHVVGDWLYIGPQDKNTAEMLRWHVEKEIADNLTVINKRNNGRYGVTFYDEVNDRLYVVWKELGEYWVVTSPSDEDAKCYCIRFAELLSGTTHCYSPMFSVDPNNKNHIWISGYYGQLAKIDITHILDETEVVAELIYKHPVLGNLGLVNSIYNAYTYQRFVQHELLYGDFIHVLPVYYRYPAGGWLDQERGVPVGAAVRSGYIPGTEEGELVSTDYYYSNRPVFMTEGALPVRGKSDDGGYYWVLAGRGGDASKIYVYDGTEYPRGQVLCTQGEIVFGNFNLSDNGSIGSIKLVGLLENIHLPAGTSYKCYVSNTEGTSWEEYDENGNGEHIFTTVNINAQVKLVFTGLETAAPYFESINDIVVYIREYNIEENMKKYRGRPSFQLRSV